MTAIERLKYPELATSSKYSDDIIGRLFEALDRVPEIKAACAHAGISDRTLRNWRHQCKALDDAVRGRLAKHVGDYIATVDAAARDPEHRDGVKAAQWLAGKIDRYQWGDASKPDIVPRNLPPDQAHELLVEAFSEPDDLVLGALAEAGWVRREE